MARIVWSSGQTAATAAKLRNAVAQGQAFRDSMAELKAIADAYATDAAFGTDIGTTGADSTTVRNLITQSYGELINSVTTQVNVGQQSGTRQLLDALG